jgi:hypothetical protein
MITIQSQTTIYGQTSIYDKSNQSKTSINCEINGKQAVIQITTCKRGRGLTSTASVMWVSGDSLSCVLFQDYSKPLIQEVTRATEKAIKTQHGKALDMLDSVISEVDAFYSKEDAA